MTENEKMQREEQVQEGRAEAGVQKKRSGGLVALLILVAVLVGLYLLYALVLSKLPVNNKTNALIINEVVTSNGSSLIEQELGSPDWVELYNGTSQPIDLEGYVLNINRTKVQTYRFPAVTIGAGEYLIVYCTKTEGTKGQLVTGFNLSKEGIGLKLVGKTGNVLDSVSVPALGKDVSWGRNQQNEFQYMAKPTPGAKNGEGQDTMNSLEQDHQKVSVTEAMPRNESVHADAEGKYYEWVELYNGGTETVNLGGWKLSDDASSPDKWSFPYYDLKPGEYAVVYLAGKNAEGKEGLYANFGLSAEENTVVLTTPLGTTSDMLEWQVPMVSNISVGKNASGEVKYFPSATPGAANAGEELDIGSFSEGSPGSVAMSEVLYENKWSVRDAGGDRWPWVELHNTSSEAVNLNTLALSDDEADPGKWRLPDVTLEADGYLIIYLSGKDQKGEELHTSFTLGNADQALVLADLTKLTYEKIAIPEDMPDNVSIGKDDSGATVYYGQPTPGKRNTTKSFTELSAVQYLDEKGLYISEICGVTSTKSGQSDWIEIYNGGSSAVALGGYYLSDSASNPKKWQIPSGVSVAAGGYTVIKAGDGGSKSASFKVSSAGETIVLADPDGNILDHIDSGALRVGVTSGRQAGDYSGTRVFFTSSTPGAANSGAISTYTKDPNFSADTGYYSGSLTLEITADADAEIYYTTDGSKPTTSSTKYTGPITLTKTTPVRAIASASGKLNSDAVSKTYLFETPHSIPVLCIAGSQSEINLVYANTDRKNKTEREVYINYLEADGTVGVEFPAGIRVTGNSTRSYAQKSLNIYLRGGYGRKSITYPFFKEYDELYTYKSLTIRNSGQDCNTCKLRDAFASRAYLDMNVDSSATQFVAVYINGRYWGLYDLKENLNDKYLATHYGVDSDATDVIRRNQVALNGTNTDFLAVRSAAKSKNLSDDAVLKEYCKKVDALGFIDYIIAQNYSCNTDMYNQKYWRSKDYTVRWRPILYDLDFSFRASSATRNMTGSYFQPQGVPSPEGTFSNMDIPVGLKKNKKWVDEFLRRAAWYSYNTLSEKTLLAVFDDMVEEMKSEVSRSNQRWGGLSGWSSDIKTMRSEISQRAKVMLKQFEAYFGVTDEYVTELLAKGQDSFWTEIEQKYGNGVREDITAAPYTK